MAEQVLLEVAFLLEVCDTAFKHTTERSEGLGVEVVAVVMLCDGLYGGEHRLAHVTRSIDLGPSSLRCLPYL